MGEDPYIRRQSLGTNRYVPPSRRTILPPPRGSGLADLITVATPGHAPTIEIFSPTDGSPIRKWSAYNPAITTGLFVAAG